MSCVSWAKSKKLRVNKKKLELHCTALAQITSKQAKLGLIEQQMSNPLTGAGLHSLF